MARERAHRTQRGCRHCLRFDTDLTNEQIVEKLLALNLDRAAAEKEQSAESKERASRAKLDEELV